MGVMFYKPGEEPKRVDVWEMEGYLSMGWSLEENPQEPEVTQDDDSALDQARAAYLEKFGEKPHHKMKLDTILEKINGNEPV